jgi:hypothetical protein
MTTVRVRGARQQIAVVARSRDRDGSPRFFLDCAKVFAENIRPELWFKSGPTREKPPDKRGISLCPRGGFV